MKQFPLHKCDKLCSLTAIGRLFEHSSDAERALSYPLRAVWRLSERPERDTHPGPRFLIMVPKKRLRRAVDRVTMRRRIREAYRLQWRSVLPAGCPLDIAFVYVASEVLPTPDISRSMAKLLGRISHSPLCLPNADTIPSEPS